MTFLLSVFTLWNREMVRFVRQRGRLFGAFGTPLLFWFFLGSGLGSSFRPPLADPTTNYLEYFFPGTILLIILFTAIFSSLSIIEDRKEGFLLSVLVAPVSRQAIVLGKILGSATLASFQGVLLILLIPLLGISLTLGKLLALGGVIFVVALSLSSLGFATAWNTQSMQGYHSIMNVLLFPMWLLSGAVFPADGAFDWVKWIMKFNPLTYALSALQHVLYADTDAQTLQAASFELSIGITLVFGMALFALSLFLVRRGSLAELV